jgi:hypothetical protein
MTIFKNKKDGKLYLLAHFTPWNYTGKWMQCKLFHGDHPWKNVSLHKEKDFIPVATR